MPNNNAMQNDDLFYITSQYENKPEYLKKNSNWRFDALRFVKKEPFWIAQVALPTQRARKKIVLSNIYLGAIAREQPSAHYELIDHLYNQGFEISVLNKRGELLPLTRAQWQDDIQLKKILSQSQLLRRDLIEDQLIERDINIQHYHILDHYETEKLLNGPDFDYTLNNINLADLSEDVVKQLKQTIPMEKVKKIKFICEADSSVKAWDILDLNESAKKMGLTQLKNISLHDIPCKKLIVPDHIQAIDIDNCQYLSELPDFSRCPDLIDISIDYCKSLTNIHGVPHTIKKLSLNDNASLGSLSLESFTQLKDLKLRMNAKIFKLEKLPATLQSLDIIRCKNAHEINLEDNLALKNLRVSYNKQLSGVKLAPNTLAHLTVHNCPSLIKNLPNLNEQKQLKSLKLHNSKKDLNVSLANQPLPELETLDLQRIDVPIDIDEYSKLKDLRLTQCRSTKQIDLRYLDSLKTVDIDADKNCQITDIGWIFPEKIENISLLGEGIEVGDAFIDNVFYKQLKSFKLINNSHLQKIFGTHPDSLVHIDVSNCDHLTDIYELSPYIKSLNVGGCRELDRIGGLDNCKELQELNLSGCHKFSIIYKEAKDLPEHILNRHTTLPHETTKLHSEPVRFVQQTQEINSKLETAEDPFITKTEIVDDEKIKQPIDQMPFDEEISPVKDTVMEKNTEEKALPVVSKETETNERVRADQPTAALKITYTMYNRTDNNTLSMIFPGEYRGMVCDQMILQHDYVKPSASKHKWQILSSSIQIKSKIADSDLQQMTAKDYLVKLPLHVKAGETVLLPTLLAGDVIQKIAVPGQCHIAYDIQHNQYQIQFTKDFDQVLTYIASKNEKRLFPHSNITTLPEKIRDQINQLLLEDDKSADKDYRSIIKQLFLVKNSSLKERVAFCRSALFDYCKNFGPTILLSANSNNLHDLLRCFKERQGVCWQRAYVYMLFCLYLNVPTRCITNEVHAYAELYSDKQWHKMDLSGAPAELDLSDKEQTINIPPQKTHKPQPEKWLPYFSPEWLIDPKEFKTTDHVIRWLCQPGSAILLTLKDRDEACQIHAAMIAYARSTKPQEIPMFYLESESDINEFLTRQSIKDGKIQSSDAGRLVKFLQKKIGILVINWDRFTANQIASYKSLLDTPPTLNGKAISPTLKIINLMTPKSHACAALYSRTKRFDWPMHIAKPERQSKLIIPDNKDDSNAIQVDLYQDAYHWQTTLLGDIQLSDKGFDFIKGPLYQAIKDKKNLVLIDAPLQDPQFQCFMHRLLVERRCYINGHLLKVPPEFSVRFQAPRNHSTPKDVLHVVSPKDLKYDPENCDIFYLHPYSVHELFKQYIIENGKMKSVPGWLSQQSKHKIMIQTAPLTDGQLRQLHTAIADMKETPVIDWVTLSGSSNNQIFAKEQLDKPGGHIIVADDPVLAKELLQMKADLIVPMNKRTDASECIEQIELKESKSDSVQFTHQIQTIAAQLLAGKTVVLYGTLSEEFYHSLEPLFFFPPRLKLMNAATPLEVTGKLTVVTAPVSFDMHLPRYNNRHSVISNEMLWKEYAERLKMHPGFKRYFAKLREFYQLASTLPHGQVGTPPFVRLNFERLRHMLDRLEQQPVGEDNPIKSLFLRDYDKDTETYLKLNVMAKKLFGNADEDEEPAVRLDKLLSFPPTSQYFWQRLNCLNAAALQTVGELDEAHLNYFLRKPYKIIKKNLDPQVKICQQLDEYLFSRNGVVLKGPAGTGKTFLAIKYAKEKHSPKFFGEQDIERFMASKPSPGTEHVLILDEANLSVPGTWDCLAPLFTHVGDQAISVTFNNKTYTLNNQFKVIFTCNPESYPSRSYHPVLQDCPTIYIEKWTDESIKNNILKRTVFKKPLTEKHEVILDQIFKIYHAVQALLPRDEVTLRDLQQVTRRWLYHMRPEISAMQAAHEAILAEWQNRFNTPVKQDRFYEKLHEIFPEVVKTSNFKTAPILTKKFPPDFYLSTTHKALLAQIQDDIFFSKASQNEKDIDGAPIVKSGILLEGPSGIGKSTLMRQLLIAMSCTECSPETLLSTTENNLQNRFFQFTLSHDIQKSAQLLRAAFDKGCKVIIDELNIDPAIETLLNYLLTGKTPEGNPAKTPGFYVLASQNNVKMAGRNALSSALMNRLHVYYTGDNERKDLLEICHQALPWFPRQLCTDIVDAYLQQQKQYPQLVNSRTFFNGLNKIHKHSRLIADVPISVKEIISFFRSSKTKDCELPDTYMKLKP